MRALSILKTLTVVGAMVLTTGAVRAADDPNLVSGHYVADPAHSQVMFVTNHLGLSTFVARFDEYTTDLTLDAENPENSKLEVTVKPASVDIDLPEFAEHMSQPEWFNTAEYPEMTFVSTSFDQETPTSGTVTGDLTIKGVTNPVTLDVELVGAGMHPMMNMPAFGIEARGTIKRSDYDMTAYIPAIPDEVQLWITAEFHQQD